MTKEAQPPPMTLWAVLTLASGSVAFGGALGAGLVGGRGGWSLFVAVLAGIVLGVLAPVVPHVVGDRVWRSIQSTAASSHQWPFRMLYIGAVIWVLMAGYLGNLITRAILAALNLGK